MESYSLEVLLSLLQLVHTRVGRDLYVCLSPMPISRMRGEGLVSPVRGDAVSTRDVPLGGHLAVRVVDDVCHEAFTRGVVASLTGHRVRD
jgi:hypothetical protein